MENSTIERQKKIVEILTLLHEGGSFEAAKQMFNESFDGVDVTEITAAEKALIQSGLDASEIQRLCNIHASVFKGSINDIHRSNYEHENPGHPVHTLKLENKVLQSLLTDELRGTFDQLAAGDWTKKARFINALKDLRQIDRHYSRKETLFFSYMEKYGITAPPKVMWGVDDTIRQLLKDLIAYAESENAAINPLRVQFDQLQHEIKEMVFKEEAIMVPMTLDVFSLDDWEQIATDSSAIGYAWIPEPLPWKAGQKARQQEQVHEHERELAIAKAKATTAAIADPMAEETNQEYYDWETKASNQNEVVLPSGILKLEELGALFSNLPVDLTFVDANDRVKFFSESEKRVFPRTKSVIGREVVNCHPPKSMHIVQQILDDFRKGSRDKADFWIDLRSSKVLIRYFALRNQTTQEYLGCLEVTQDITDIQQLTGQKRLLDETL
ncbi:DUF438 domain-containing protein [Enterococcus faecalis]